MILCLILCVNLYEPLLLTLLQTIISFRSWYWFKLSLRLSKQFKENYRVDRAFSLQNERNFQALMSTFTYSFTNYTVISLRSGYWFKVVIVVPIDFKEPHNVAQIFSLQNQRGYYVSMILCAKVTFKLTHMGNCSDLCVNLYKSLLLTFLRVIIFLRSEDWFKLTIRLSRKFTENYSVDRICSFQNKRDFQSVNVYFYLLFYKL